MNARLGEHALGEGPTHDLVVTIVLRGIDGAPKPEFSVGPARSDEGRPATPHASPRPGTMGRGSGGADELETMDADFADCRGGLYVGHRPLTC